MNKKLAKALRFGENLLYLGAIGLVITMRGKARWLILLALLVLVGVSILKNWEFFKGNIMMMIYSAERFLYGKPLKTRWDKNEEEDEKDDT